MIQLVIIDILFIAVLTLAVQRSLRYYKRTVAARSEARLAYIRTLIETVYVFGNKPDMLQSHIKHEMSIKKLLFYGVIERQPTEASDPARRINETDQLVYQLLQNGFSPRELCVIFNLNNINSLYVKYHRINRKLERQNISNHEAAVPESRISYTTRRHIVHKKFSRHVADIAVFQNDPAANPIADKT